MIRGDNLTSDQLAGYIIGNTESYFDIDITKPNCQCHNIITDKISVIACSLILIFI